MDSHHKLFLATLANKTVPLLIGYQIVHRNARKGAAYTLNIEKKGKLCPQPNFFPKELMLSLLGKWQPTPVLLPGESHGRRSLVGYSLWGHKESDTTKQISLSLH